MRVLRRLVGCCIFSIIVGVFFVSSAFAFRGWVGRSQLPPLKAGQLVVFQPDSFWSGKQSASIGAPLPPRIVCRIKALESRTWRITHASEFVEVPDEIIVCKNGTVLDKMEMEYWVILEDVGPREGSRVE